MACTWFTWLSPSNLWTGPKVGHPSILFFIELLYGVDPFFPNFAVEEVPNYELLLDHSHFAYVEPLPNHTSSTAKLGTKRIHPVQGKSFEPFKKVLTCAEMVLWKVYFYQKNDVWHLLIKVFLLSQLQLKLTLFFHVHPKRKFSNISILLNFPKFLIFWEMWTSTWTF